MIILYISSNILDVLFYRNCIDEIIGKVECSHCNRKVKQKDIQKSLFLSNMTSSFSNFYLLYESSTCSLDEGHNNSPDQSLMDECNDIQTDSKANEIINSSLDLHRRSTDVSDISGANEQFNRSSPQQENILNFSDSKTQSTKSKRDASFNQFLYTQSADFNELIYRDIEMIPSIQVARQYGTTIDDIMLPDLASSTRSNKQNNVEVAYSQPISNPNSASPTCVNKHNNVEVVYSQPNSNASLSSKPQYDLNISPSLITSEDVLVVATRVVQPVRKSFLECNDTYTYEFTENFEIIDCDKSQNSPNLVHDDMLDMNKDSMYEVSTKESFKQEIKSSNVVNMKSQVSETQFPVPLIPLIVENHNREVHTNISIETPFGGSFLGYSEFPFGLEHENDVGYSEAPDSMQQVISDMYDRRKQIFNTSCSIPEKNLQQETLLNEKSNINVASGNDETQLPHDEYSNNDSKETVVDLKLKRPSIQVISENTEKENLENKRFREQDKAIINSVNPYYVMDCVDNTSLGYDEKKTTTIIGTAKSNKLTVTANLSSEYENYLLQCVVKKFIRYTTQLSFEESDLTQKYILVVEAAEVRLGYRLTKKTKRFLRSICCGMWIIDVTWLKDSIKAGKLLDHSKYEISGCVKGNLGGPKRARLAVNSYGYNNLFENYEFFIIHASATGNIVSNSNSDDVISFISWLIQKSCGVVIGVFSNLEDAIQAYSKRILNRKKVILCEDSNSQSICITSDIDIFTFNWLYDAISEHQVAIDKSAYLIT